MRNNYLRLFMILLLTAAFALAACGGDEPVIEETADEPTAVPVESVEESAPEPTEEPTPETVEEAEEEIVQEGESEEEMAEEEVAEEAESEEEMAEEEMVEEPTTSLGQEATSEEGGFTLSAPEGFTLDVFGDSVNIAAADADPDLGPQIFVSSGPLEEGQSVDTLYVEFQTTVLQDIAETMGSANLVEQGGLTGYSVDFTTTENDTELTGRLVILGDDARGFVMFGAAETGRWNDEFVAQYEAILASATFFEPVMTDTGSEEMAEEEMEEEEGKEKVGEGEGAAVGVPIGSGEAGIACAGSLVDGVTCLTTDGTWLPFNTDNSNMGGDIIEDLIACGNMIVIADNNGLTMFDGESFTTLEGGWGFSSASGVACDDNGGYWVTHFKGVSYYDGASWTTYESELLSSGDSFSDLVESVVIAPDGTVWVSSANAVAAFNGADWTIYQQGQGMFDNYFFDTLILGGDGQPWALHSSGLLQWTGSEWVDHDSDFFSLEGAAVDGDGNIWVGTFDDGITQYNGSSWSNFTTDDGLSNNNVRDIAVDGSGRVWAATAYGLSVWTGFDWQVYRMDTADMIDHNLYTVAVAGAGPALPEPLAKDPGTLTGYITLNDEPFVNTTVEICIETIGFSYFGETPCADQQYLLTIMTDDTGNFTFNDVPEGLYVITVNTGDGWAQLETDYGTGERVFIGAGETTDVGELFIITEE